MPGQTTRSEQLFCSTLVLQWRAGQLPGQTSLPRGAGTDGRKLQWRAGQLPGQTGDLLDLVLGLPGASMEGRAIARPNWPTMYAGSTRGRCFNGGPGNCPAKPAASASKLFGDDAASMEGRAIARPNLARRTLPAAMPVLQWRAGQLPGQTHRRRRPRAQPLGASMEGRAIARPNSMIPAASSSSKPVLQWRAGQLPGQTTVRSYTTGLNQWLQWRAGQLPGQTGDYDDLSNKPTIRFNGGPGNCPAKRGLTEVAVVPHLLASMEGRAIARPN